MDLQTLFIEFLLADKDLFVRCNAITDPMYFDSPLRPVVRFIKEYVNKYQSMPKHDLVYASTDIEFRDLTVEVDEASKLWFIDEFPTFCRHKAIELAILQSSDLLAEKKYGEVEEKVKAAVQLGLAKELGMNYWEDPVARLEKVRQERGSNSTGWKDLDYHLYGGVNRGDLNIFTGGSGAGKSLFLQNLAINWALMGHNVIYVSLELSEALCSMRLDAMITGYSTRDVMKNSADVALRLGTISKKAGAIQIVQLPNGCDVNTLRAYIKEYQIQNNIKVDAVLVDYLDLMMPAQQKVPPSDLFIKDKFVSEELRNFASEGNYLFATASQLNRQSVDAIELDHSHISGGLSKIQTADNVVGIFSSLAMKERGRIQIQFLKTRNSAGVGKKIELSLHADSLRISDVPDDDDSSNNHVKKLYNSLPTSNPLSKGEISSPPDKVESAVNDVDRLRSILKRTN